MIRPRYFQWIDGENMGTVETLLNITTFDGEYFYNFHSGESCNQRYIARMTRSKGELKGKVMVEVISPNDAWTVETIKMGTFKTADEQYVDVPPLEDIVGASGSGNNINLGNTHLGEKRLKAPNYGGPYPELPSLDDYLVVEEEVPATPKQGLFKRRSSAPAQETVAEEVKELPAAPVVESAPQPAVIAAPQPAPQPYTPPKPESKPQPSNPVELLAKSCKKHATDINLTVTIDLPSRSMFKMVNDEFENGGEAFVNCLISQLDINEVIDSIRNSLLIAYLKDEDAENE